MHGSVNFMYIEKKLKKVQVHTIARNKFYMYVLQYI